MRIIGGNLKSKGISFLKSKTSRPLKDSVKENIFNILTHSKLFKVNLVRLKQKLKLVTTSRKKKSNLKMLPQ